MKKKMYMNILLENYDIGVCLSNNKNLACTMANVKVIFMAKGYEYSLPHICLILLIVSPLLLKIKIDDLILQQVISRPRRSQGLLY